MSLAGHASPGNRGPAPVTAGRLTPGYLHSGPARTPRRRLQRDRTFPRRPLRSRRMLFCPQQKRTVPERGGAQTYGLAACLPD